MFVVDATPKCFSTHRRPNTQAHTIARTRRAQCTNPKYRFFLFFYSNWNMPQYIWIVSQNWRAFCSVCTRRVHVEHIKLKISIECKICRARTAADGAANEKENDGRRNHSHTINTYSCWCWLVITNHRFACISFIICTISIYYYPDLDEIRWAIIIRRRVLRDSSG